MVCEKCDDEHEELWITHKGMEFLQCKSKEDNNNGGDGDKCVVKEGECSKCEDNECVECTEGKSKLVTLHAGPFKK